MQRLHFLLLVFALVFYPCGFLNARYVLTELGDFPGGQNQSFAGSINSSGQVTGIAYAASGPRAFLWNPTTPNSATGSMVDLGDLSGGTGNVSPAGGINTSGQVAGRSIGSLGQERTFLWTPTTPNGTSGSMVNIGALPSQRSARPTGINDYGQIVGSSFSPQQNRPFLWTPSSAGGTNGSMIDLGLLPGGTLWGGALEINSRGQVVGYSDTAASDHAFLWNPDAPNGTTGSMFDIGVLQGMSFSLAYGINELGQVTGYSGNTSTADFRAFIWQPATANGGAGTMFDLGNLPGDTLRQIAFEINSDGLIVGSLHSNDPSGAEIAAFLWIPDTPNGTSGVMHNLNDLIQAGSGTGWTLTSANGINDRGQITGRSMYDADGPGGEAAVPRGFLLTPLPEPSAIHLLWLGLGLQHCLLRSRYPFRTLS